MINANGSRHDCAANLNRVRGAQQAFDEAIRQAMVQGFYGEVRVTVKFQDGVVQNMTVERSQTIR